MGCVPSKAVVAPHPAATVLTSTKPIGSVPTPPRTPQPPTQPPTQPPLRQNDAPSLYDISGVPIPSTEPGEQQHQEIQQEIKDEPLLGEKESEEEDPLTEKVIQQFIDYEAEVRLLENNKVEENLIFHETQVKNLQDAYAVSEEYLEGLRKKTEKEKQDVVEFDIANYMANKHIAVMTTADTFEAPKIEEEEYIAAKNKQDVAEKEVKNILHQLSIVYSELEKTRQEVDQLNTARQNADKLLADVFDGEYGSDVENRLELEAEQLLQYKQHISVAHFKWYHGRNLMYHACTQFAYASRRWEQIQQVSPSHLQAKLQMVADVRNNLLAANQNVIRGKEYLRIQLPYCNDDDLRNVQASVGTIWKDIITFECYENALRWYKYYHWKSALLLNWMDQTINYRILKDHRDASDSYNLKYTELRKERLRCIYHDILHVDVDVDHLIKEDSHLTIDLEVEPTKSGIALTIDSSPAETQNEEDPPPALDSQQDPMEVPAPPETQGSSGPPAATNIPLSELAPMPTTEQLFGNINELKEAHKRQLAIYERTQDLNKVRMEQGLQDRLNARRTKKRKVEIHNEQMAALLKDSPGEVKPKDIPKDIVEEEMMTVTMETVIGGDGNPDVIAQLEKEDNNVAQEEIVTATTETFVGGDGNPDVIAQLEKEDNNMVEEEMMTVTMESVVGGDGNPDGIAQLEKEDNNVVQEEMVTATTEAIVGGDGNPDVLRRLDEKVENNTDSNNNSKVDE